MLRSLEMDVSVRRVSILDAHHAAVALVAMSVFVLRNEDNVTEATSGLVPAMYERTCAPRQLTPLLSEHGMRWVWRGAGYKTQT